ncbi:MAG: type II toxin-antitoxin system RelE family toxin [Bacillota bacterium]
MERYKLIFKRSVAKDLRSLPAKDIARILQCFEALANDPRAPGCEKLSGHDKYRVRQGVYRIVYGIDDTTLTVTIVKVGHRRDIYRNNQDITVT